MVDDGASRSEHPRSASIDVEAERIRAAYRHLLVTVLATMINATVMTALMVGIEDGRTALGWLAAVLLTGALRLAAWRSYWRRPRALRTGRRWAAIAVSGALVSGVLWGGGSVLLLPSSETYQLLWVFVLGGMCAGASVFHSAHLPSALSFIVPASLPLMLRFALDGAGGHGAVAAMIAVFVVALVIASYRGSRQFGDTVRLQFDLVQRTRDLDALNERLRAEIAEHHATAASLRQAQRMEAIGLLAGGIAHDLNNVLQVVQGGGTLLQDGASNADEVRRVARLILEAAQRGAGVTQRLLSFSRRSDLHAEAVDVPELLRSMEELLSSTLGGGLEVRVEVPQELPAVRADRAQLETVLVNLATNARDAMGGSGILTMAASAGTVQPGSDLPVGLKPGRYIRLDVTDEGCGMDSATLARVTEPFFTTKPQGQGTGLGLSMAQGYAERSGGGLHIESAPGRGTTVTLWLPAAERDVLAPRTAAAAGVDPPRFARLLLADDDATVREIVARQMEAAGYEVLAVGTGKAALEQLDAGAAVDVVVSDLSMPGMDGLALIREARRRRPALPAVLLTGYLADRDDADAADPYVLVRKPVEGRQLAERVAALLRGETGPDA